MEEGKRVGGVGTMVKISTYAGFFPTAREALIQNTPVSKAHVFLSGTATWKSLFDKRSDPSKTQWPSITQFCAVVFQNCSHLLPPLVQDHQFYQINLTKANGNLPANCKPIQHVFKAVSTSKTTRCSYCTPAKKKKKYKIYSSIHLWHI